MESTVLATRRFNYGSSLGTGSRLASAIYTSLISVTVLASASAAHSTVVLRQADLLKVCSEFVIDQPYVTPSYCRAQEHDAIVGNPRLALSAILENHPAALLWPGANNSLPLLVPTVLWKDSEYRLLSELTDQANTNASITKVTVEPVGLPETGTWVLMLVGFALSTFAVRPHIKAVLPQLA